MMVASDRAAARTCQRDACTGGAGSQPEEAFARALREKGLATQDADAGDDADGNDAGTGKGSSQASLLTCPIAPPPALPGSSPAPGCDVDGADSGGDGPAAGLEATSASAAATAARSMLTSTSVDADSTAWEASVCDDSGVAIELRAEPAAPSPGERAAWSVTIVSPALASEILARHAPQLVDRLRRQGIGSRVRIDGALDDRGSERE
jgi:hypothetical protein